VTGTELGPQGPATYVDAATVVLLRDRGSELECLMLHKTRGQSFGGAWVFPGGRVEDGDGTGLDGARQAAVREAAEETGLVLEVDSLVPIAHWSPPPTAPKRFATWFFVAALPEGAADVVVDGGEIGDHVWTTPAAALERHARDEIELMPPTWMTLHRLLDHPDVSAALDDAAEGVVERFSTRMVVDGGVLVSLWEPDAAYPASANGEPGALATPGPRHRLYMTPGGWRYEHSVEAN
jgi:8-oxo-dGTP pyrophosphatase MutT (NUDIX family)